MQLLTDRQVIRQLLRRDPVWAAYALGDLGPDLWPHTTWHRAGDELALVLRSYQTPILWASGSLGPLASEVRDEARYSVQLRPAALPSLEPDFHTAALKTMWRMSLQAADFRPVPHLAVQRFGADAVADLESLYRDGVPAGESPEFFFPEMVSRGVFCGVRDHAGIAAVAGTHLLDTAERVATIGNVYTRRDRRGQGLAAQATSAVANELLRLGVDVIVLNVYQANAAAIHIYEKIGFRIHCDFVEGIIERRA